MQLRPSLIIFGLLVGIVGCTAAAPTPTPTFPPPPTAEIVLATISPTPPTQPTIKPTNQPTSQPTAIPTPTELPTIFKPGVGLQIHLHAEDVEAIMTQLRRLGVGWVKVQVSWKLFEPRPGEIDPVWFAEVDALVAAAVRDNIRVMLGVAKAPEWSRPTTEMDGPPGDPADFANFMQLLATRYQGQVAAYELWNETNLQREWNGVPLSAADFANMVAVGAAAVRQSDPQAIILSGAPAPTGINDGVTAIDDRVYFAQALTAGLADHVDGFGVHPYGWGNPPDSTAANPAPVPSHNDHPSFFFLDTLNDYSRLLREAGVDPAVQQLWPTEFGWGTTDGFGQPPVPGNEFMNYLTEQDQADFLVRALAIAAERPDVGPQMIWNLNFAATFGPALSESAYGIVRPDGSLRPAFEALRVHGQ